ncbi:MAG: MFS transporter [Candidatus Bathyarchaeia archaeon]
MPEGARKDDLRWIYSVVPINVALGPIGTLIQLLILNLHGSVIDIGLAITLFNAVSIPSAILWGIVTDRYHKRNPLLILSYLLIAGIISLLWITMTIHGIEVLYAIISFFSAASATPLNLLIMETQPKSRWTSAFAKLSMASSVGVTLGLLLGVAWGDFLPLNLIMIPLAVLSVASAVVSFLTIPEPTVGFERVMMVLVRRSFYARLLALPILFLRIPRASDFKRVFKGMRFELTREPLLLYLSIIAFYLSSGIFNTSLVPSYYQAKITNSEVFLILLAGMIVQTIAFNSIAPRVEKRSLKETAVSGLTLRSICYVLLGISAYLFTGALYLGANLILYPLSGGIAYAAYYAASNVMVFNSLGADKHGSTLGVYSALVGFATTIGSFISGFISFYEGYHTTFIIAGLIMASAGVLTSMLHGGKAANQFSS